ncbi:hypothetical protein BsWGS_25048 [Bradybaena similaris]
MAASGVNEHYEACRKQNLVNKRAYLARTLWETYGSKTCDDSPQHIDRTPPTGSPLEQQDILRAYHLEKTYRRHQHDERNKTLKEHHQPKYSAKLSNRFNSINYCQQW